MKKFLPAFLALFLLAACSGDDSSPVDENPNVVDPDTGVFKRIVETVHENHGDYKITYDYTNGKLSRKAYSVDDFETYHYAYEYNAQGLMSKETMQPSAGSTSPTIVHTYTYDALGRLREIEAFSNGEPGGGITFTYSGNTVTTANADGISGNTYTVENNLVTKAVEHSDVFGDSFIEIQYDGTNAISATDGFGNWAFTYDSSHDASILGLSDGNGTFKANSILRNENFFNHPLNDIATKYLLSDGYIGDFSSDYDYSNQYTYTFSPGGRPLTVMKYYDGELQSETEYIYEVAE